MDLSEHMALCELAMIIAAQHNKLVSLRLKIQELQSYKDSKEVPF